MTAPPTHIPNLRVCPPYLERRCYLELMNAAAARRYPGDEEAFDPAEELITREIIRGVEMMSPRPAKKHIGASSRLQARISYHFDGQAGGPEEPRGWMIVQEPELRLEGQDPISPDIAGWRELRAPEEDDEAAYRVAPDWVCETLSPRTKNYDRESKMPFYAFHRVGHLWLLDPIGREVEVYALGRRGWELLGTYGGNKVVRVEPFEERELDLSMIWSRPRAYLR